MSMKDNHISYIEFKTSNIEKTKSFYQTCFGWSFSDFGDDYTSFKGSGVHGGFEKTDTAIAKGALVVLYHQNLSEIKQIILSNGGTISKDLFSFPGGRRFHFEDPSGNELAVWSDK